VLAHYQADARVAVTAVTAQSDQRVFSQHPLPASMIADQIQAAAPVRAVKIGMLGAAEAVHAVADNLALLAPAPVVLDPVLASSSGTALLTESGRVALIEVLAPRVTLLTPNLQEAAILLGRAPAESPQEMQAQAEALSELCACALLLKGGHNSDAEAADLLFAQGEATGIIGTRLAGSMRGTGCALSTAIAIELGRGRPLREACLAAKALVEALISTQVSGPSSQARASSRP
jgi:hydroxymethylpyrimidine/phosphomethylpyrimidine kinase